MTRKGFMKNRVAIIFYDFSSSEKMKQEVAITLKIL